MDDGGDVECEPGARHDDDPRRIVGGGGVSLDFAPIEFVPEFDAGVSRRPGKERLTKCHAAIGVGAYRLFLSWYSARRWRYSFTTASAFFCRPLRLQRPRGARTTTSFHPCRP